MDTLTKALAIGAGASLLQACGSGGGNPNPYSEQLSPKARQMLYLAPDTPAEPLRTAVSRSSNNFYRHGNNLERHQFDRLSAEAKLLFQLLFNGRDNQTEQHQEGASARPLCSDYFNLWVTYQLLNSFVLAMGDELDTVSSARINTHIEKIRDAVAQGRSVPDIMRDYFMGDIFWARFRSPEDNGREVMEIYLGDFRDEIVPVIGKILRNYSFNEDQGTLDIDPFNHNDEPQTLNGTTLTTPLELYSYVVNHPEFMPHIYRHIISALYGEANEQVLADLNARRPTDFREIYILALTHRAINQVQRPKYPEEILLPMVKSLDITLRRPDISDLIKIASRTGSPPLFSKLERRPPDWNALNTAQLAQLCDSRIPKELWTTDITDYYSWGISHEQFAPCYVYVDEPAQLLSYLHQRIWDETDVAYPESFVRYLSDSGETGRRLILLALQIVVMNYGQYNFN